MSAILPSHVRKRVEEALGNLKVVRPSPTLFRQFLRHRLHLLDDELLSERILEEVVRQFRQGRSVLAACNTVKRAQEVYKCPHDRAPLN